MLSNTTHEAAGPAGRPERKRRSAPGGRRARPPAGAGRAGTCRPSPGGGLHAALGARLAEAQARLAELHGDGAEALLGQPSPAPEGAPPEGAGPPGGGDACRLCGGELRRATHELALICGECGLVEAGDPTQPDGETPQPSRDPARVRIVGPGSAPLQPDLHRSGQGPSPEAQQRQIFEEYQAYVQLHTEAGGRSYPETALRRAAGYYNVVQRQCVKRAQNKKAIMAACLWRGCLDCGISPQKTDIAQLMQLQNHGIARGTNFIRGLVADGKMEIDINADPCRPEITTLFAGLGLDGAEFAGLRAATFEVVQVANENHIGTGSVLRSKVAGAAFAVLRRSSRALLPRPFSLAEFCAARIRKNTLDRFLKELEAYHSFFAPVYAAAGLDAGPRLP